MEQESHLIEARLQQPTESMAGGRRYVAGTLRGIEIVTAVSGFGKVAAAATVAQVLERYSPSHVIFGGVAGGIGLEVDIGDIVIADRLVQHDFDASPLFEPFVIPSLGVAEVATDPGLTERLMRAARRYLQTTFATDMADVSLDLFEPERTKVHQGLVASGDQFVDSLAQARNLIGEHPDVLAVEMEGAAVAQVCAEAQVPFAVFRSISDRADHKADIDFLAFISGVAAPITAGLVEELLVDLRQGDRPRIDP